MCVTNGCNVPPRAFRDAHLSRGPMWSSWWPFTCLHLHVMLYSSVILCIAVNILFGLTYSRRSIIGVGPLDGIKTITANGDAAFCDIKLRCEDFYHFYNMGNPLKLTSICVLISRQARGSA